LTAWIAELVGLRGVVRGFVKLMKTRVPIEDEKDRLGRKLRDVEKAREDQWAAERDRELLEKLRKKMGLQSSPELQCPVCGKTLKPVTLGEIKVDECQEHGAWLDRATLQHLLTEILKKPE